MAAHPNPQKGRRPTPQKGRRPAPAQPAGGSEQPTASGPDPRFPIRTNWTARLLAAWRWVVAVATGETGRRVARALALTVVLAVLVTALYDHGEAPRAAAAPAVETPAAGAGAGPGLQKVRRKALAQPGGLRGRDRATAVGERPAAVAADWYAARHGVARARVKPLQQDRLSAREVRVLVLVDRGRGRLETALVRVHRGADGWRVR